MIVHHELFVKAIHEKIVLTLIFDASEKGIITRKCIPYDFAVSRKYKDGLERYHLCDLDSPDGRHTLSILPHQIISLDLTAETFEPSHYITWSPTRWTIVRDWGVHS
jgi:hypothetical protein